MERFVIFLLVIFIEIRKRGKMETVKLEILCTWDCPVCSHSNLMSDWDEALDWAVRNCNYCGVEVKIVKNEKD